MQRTIMTKRFPVTMLAGALALSALAAAQTLAAQTLSDCVAVDDDAERLACYDRVTKAARRDERPAAPAAPAAPPAAEAAEAPAVQATPAPAPSPTETGDFGFENRKTATGAQQIESRYDDSFTGWSGKTLFRLENGQVWKQAQNGRVSYRAERPVITVKRAAFGSFRLHVEGLNRSIRVKRVK